MKESIRLSRHWTNWMKILDEDIKMPKTSISFIVYTVYRSIKDKKAIRKTIDAIKDFLNTYETNEEYKSYIKQGTTASESVINRLNYWENVTKSI